MKNLAALALAVHDTASAVDQQVIDATVSVPWPTVEALETDLPLALTNLA
jgi:hypothetical protein